MGVGGRDELAAGRDAGGFFGNGFGFVEEFAGHHAGVSYYDRRFEVALLQDDGFSEEGSGDGVGGAFEHAAIDDEGEPGGGDVDLGGTGEKRLCLGLE